MNANGSWEWRKVSGIEIWLGKCGRFEAEITSTPLRDVFWWTLLEDGTGMAICNGEASRLAEAIATVEAAYSNEVQS
jgi:hypothetical protein